MRMRVIESVSCSSLKLSQIPVILTSAGPPYIEARADAGWLPKPFDAERLLDLVGERVAGKSRHEDPNGSFGAGEPS